MKKRVVLVAFVLIFLILLIVPVSALSFSDIFQKIKDFFNIFNIQEDQELKGELVALSGVSDEDLIGHYEFEGNANDSSGNGNHGTVYGAVSGTGVLGQGYEFDGDNDYIKLNNIGFTGNQELTWIAWVNPGTVDNADAILWYPDECVLRLKTGNNGVEFILNSFSSNDRVTSNANAWNLNEWNQVGAMYNGTNLCVIVNGVVDNCVQPTGSYGRCTYLDLGIRAQSTNDYNGKIDEG